MVDHPGQALSPARPGASERRVSGRATVRLAAAYEDAERQVFLPTRDLSLSGVFLLSPARPAVGTPATVLLELPDEPAFLRLRGSVVRRQEAERGLPEGFALRFEAAALSEPIRQALASFLGKTLSHGE